MIGEPLRCNEVDERRRNPRMPTHCIGRQNVFGHALPIQNKRHALELEHCRFGARVRTDRMVTRDDKQAVRVFRHGFANKFCDHFVHVPIMPDF